MVLTINSPPVVHNDVVSVATAIGGGGTVDATAATGVLANDSDPNGDNLSVSALSGGAVGTASAGAHGNLTLNADGSFSYTVTNTTGTVATDGHLHDLFTYTASDGHGGTASANLNIVLNVAGENYSGGNGGQTHTGTLGNDVINGGNAKDNLNGGAGDDIISGGNGVDVLNGGLGNDQLTGGNGSDTFAFNANFGKDVVTDFSKDTVQFDHGVFANFAAVQSHMANDGHGNTIITYDANNTVTLLGVTTAQLHASDFAFV
jgi:VCBS repeat-containing protein